MCLNLIWMHIKKFVQRTLFLVYVHDYVPPMFPELENDEDEHPQSVNGDLVSQFKTNTSQTFI